MSEQQTTLTNCKINELILRRDDLNDQILAFEIRAVNVERVDYNQYVTNAKELLVTLISDIKGAPHKDVHEVANFTRLSFPNMKDQDALMALLMWNVFAVFLDDFLDGHTTHQAYWVRKWALNITIGYSDGTDFLDLYFNELRARMNKVLPGKLILWHNSWYMKYLDYYDETENVKVGDRMYTIAEYDSVRMVDVGYDIEQVFLYGSAKFDPDEYPVIVTDASWTVFNTWAARHLYMVNDLFSSKKETLQHQGKFTMIYVIMYNDKCDAQTAADKLAAMIDEAWTMVIEHGDKLKIHDITLLHQYITDIQCLLKGNIYWSSIRPRYNKFCMTITNSKRNKI